MPHTRYLIVALIALFALQGCVNSRYKLVPEKKARPAQPLSVEAADEDISTELVHLIVYQGPGSWKLKANWDEYVIQIRNEGKEPLVVLNATLIDPVGDQIVPGDDPWEIEELSRSQQEKYRELGMNIVKGTAPAVILGSATVGYGAAAAYGGAAWAGSMAAGLGVATVVVLPSYYTYAFFKNRSNRQTCETIFAQRSFAFPFLLKPGERATGSLYFPITPSPRELRWKYREAESEAASKSLSVNLLMLEGLHLDQNEEEEADGKR